MIYWQEGDESSDEEEHFVDADDSDSSDEESDNQTETQAEQSKGENSSLSSGKQSATATAGWTHKSGDTGQYVCYQYQSHYITTDMFVLWLAEVIALRFGVSISKVRFVLNAFFGLLAFAVTC